MQDPKGNEHAAAVDCWSPWEGTDDVPPSGLMFEQDDDGMGSCVLQESGIESSRTCTMDMVKHYERLAEGTNPSQQPASHTTLPSSKDHVV